MFRVYNRLLFFVLAIFSVVIFLSCEQPDDVITAVSQSVLHLTSERVPELPVGMVYELWVSKDPAATTDISITSDRITSLGKFSYVASDTLVAFLNSDGSLRADSNRFVLEDDLFSYRSLFVSVEVSNDPDPSRPGPIMLIGNIVQRDDIMPVLNFPFSEDLWRSTVRYNLEAVSDNNRNANDAEGIWFSSYRTTEDTIPDTFALSVTFQEVEIVPEIDTTITMIIDTLTPPDTIIDTVIDTLNKDSLYARRPFDILNIDTSVVKIIYGPDTLLLGIDSFMHTRVIFEVDSLIDSTDPFTKRVFSFDYSVRNHLTDPSRIVVYDIFTQDEFDLPDHSAYGWKYEGWVVSPYIPKNVTGEFTPPVWTYKTGSRNWIPGDTGGVVSTGTFTRIDLPDDNDPFTLLAFAGEIPIVDSLTGDTTWVTKYKRPRYPGEDFLNTDSLTARYGLTEIDLMPGAFSGSIEGTVFISLEPANRLTTSTNFPLIAFTGEVPRSFADLAGNPQPYVVNMINKSGSVIGQIASGFPEIRVQFQRF